MKIEERDPIFVQIATGAYEWYSEKHRQKYRGHCVYALAEDGTVWKFIVPRREWKPLKDLTPDYHDDPWGREL